MKMVHLSFSGYHAHVHLLRSTLTACAMWYFLVAVVHPEKWRFIDNVNLIFHEAGHPLFSFMGPFSGALGGTLMQLLVPLVCAISLVHHGDRWGSALVMLWFAQSLAKVSVYVKDARTMALPLVGGDGVGHDWNYLLGTLHLLPYDTLLATILQSVALACALMASLFALHYSLTITRA